LADYNSLGYQAAGDASILNGVILTTEYFLEKKNIKLHGIDEG